MIFSIVLALAAPSAAVPVSQKTSAAGAAPTILLSELAPPSQLVAAPQGNDVRLAWRDNSSSEQSFVVLRRSLPSLIFQELAVVPANQTSYSDLGAPNGTHVYRVAARSSDGFDSPRSNPVKTSFPNLPPSVSFSIPQETHFRGGSLARFTVTVSDPEGDAITLRILNPFEGMIFEPAENVPGPITREVRWYVMARAGLSGRRELLFDTGVGGSTTLALHSETTDLDRGAAAASTNYADVTGDGRADLIVPAEGQGAAYVFAGASVPEATPAATLAVAGEMLGARGPEPHPRYLQVADVTGDGGPDVIAQARSQTIFIWEGGVGMSGAPPPAAVLAPPGTSPAYSLANTGGQNVQLVDVSGDGVLDIVSCDPSVSAGGVSTAGAVFFWRGGASLVGTRAPDNLLMVPGAHTGDSLGVGETSGQSVQLADVTGDGVLDFIVEAPLANIGGLPDVGAAYLWDGASVLAGGTTPVATLSVADTRPGRFAAGGDERILLADVSGDGILDLLVASEDLQRIGVVHVWNGGLLSGTPPPNASLRTGTVESDTLFVGVLLAVDLTGDEILDVLATDPYADQPGKSNTGAVYLWAGGGLVGTTLPSTTLRVTDAVPWDLLGYRHVHVADLTGDGLLDVIALAPLADVDGVENAGAFYVFAGGTLTGFVDPVARLRVPGAQAFDELTSYGGSTQVEDVTGDGVLDLVVSAPLAAGSGVDDGAIYLWEGGTLSGDVAPRATLVAPGSGWLGGTAGMTLVDVDADGALDLFSGSHVGSQLYFWRGGSSGVQTPDGTLDGSWEYASENVRQLVDLDRDGSLDLLASAARSDFGAADTGALYLWSGGDFDGSAARVFSVPGGAAGDMLNQIGLFDLDGDHVLDLVSCAYQADVDGVVDAGAIYFWKGANLSAPPLRMSVPGAIANAQLGL